MMQPLAQLGQGPYGPDGWVRAAVGHLSRACTHICTVALFPTEATVKTHTGRILHRVITAYERAWSHPFLAWFRWSLTNFWRGFAGP